MLVREDRRNSNRLDPDLEKARTKWHQLMAGRRELESNPTVRELIVEFLAWAKTHNAPATVDFYRGHLASFSTACGHHRVPSLKTRHVNQWLDARYTKPKNGSTRNGAIRSVKRVFIWAVGGERIEITPVASLMAPVPTRRNGCLTPDQHESLMNAKNSCGGRLIPTVLPHPVRIQLPPERGQNRCGKTFGGRLEVVRLCILVLVGATEDGRKELIAVTDDYRESEPSWRSLLLDVKARGLVNDPKLATGDGALGFWKTLPQVYPSTREQRCWVHKTANVLDKSPNRLQDRQDPSDLDRSDERRCQ